MRGGWSLVGLMAVASVVASGLHAGDPGRDGFPHAEHARLFPTCTGCHAGASAGSKADMFPSKEACVACHDGEELRKVDWSAPHTRGTNLSFSHADHAAGLAEAGESAACSRCHTANGAVGGADSATSVRATMRALAGPQPQACIGCHAHEAPTHLAKTAECRTCHVSLARAARFDSARIAALPRPTEHDAADFVLKHGSGLRPATARGQCAICHARESCERCHLNAPAVPAIAALESDPRVAALTVGRAAHYPPPQSHRAGWDAGHGAAARGAIQSCANCHAQAGCRSCHIGEGGQKEIAQLPTPRPSGPMGALAPAPVRATVAVKGAPTGKVKALVFRPPTRVRAHAAGFAESHGAAASSGSLSCSACHEKTFCSNCHAGSSKPVFHPANFLSRHGADAYGGAKDCGSCHNTESFCRDCHQGAGVASHGRVDVAFHTGQPMWLLQHGEAARKGLEGCTSCHRQQDCTRCHSASSGWGVNPHGPGFDAGRIGDRNQLTCARCHVTTPGRTP